MKFKRKLNHIILGASVAVTTLVFYLSTYCLYTFIKNDRAAFTKDLEIVSIVGFAGMLILTSALSIALLISISNKPKRTIIAYGLLAIFGLSPLLMTGVSYINVLFEGDKESELAKTYYNSGIAHANKGDYDSAIEDYTKAIKINPKNACTYNNRGITYANKGDSDAAIRDYSKAIQINPKHADTYYNRGLALLEKGDLEGAINDYNKFLSLQEAGAPDVDEVRELIKKIKLELEKRE